MKKLFPATCALLFLISCTKAGDLPSNEVLQKAGEQSQTLSSATFAMDASFQGNIEALAGDWDGNISVAGTMANAGKQLQFAVNVTADKTDTGDLKSKYDINSDIMIGSENEIYMRMNTLTIDPPSTLLPPELVAMLLNQWWVIPAASGANLNPAADVSPDPTMLRMQTSVIAVTKDHGLNTINGHEAYLYDISVDPVKMREYLTKVSQDQKRTATPQELTLAEMDATGKIWIDAKTFVIHRIVWDIESKDLTQPLTVNLDIRISGHNKPVIITPPENAAPFPGLTDSLLSSGSPSPLPALQSIEGTPPSL